MARGKPIHPSSSDDANLNDFESWFATVVLVYLLVCALSMITTGFRIATGDRANELFTFATNPFIGLAIGTIAAALVQSSSTVTTIIVGLAAAGLPVSIAVPMVMGANVGTTITNTIVSLGHIRDKTAFRRAFAAATVLDQFNLLSILILFPLEIAFGVLEKLGHSLASILVGRTAVDVESVNFLKAATNPVVDLVAIPTASLPHPLDGIMVILVGGVLLFGSITFLGKLLKRIAAGPGRQLLLATIGRGPLTGIGSGALITMVVQSSSTTTSLVVPLAGTGVVSLRQIYPFSLGAEIGTCVTALLAATAISGAKAFFALQIALVHLLYSVLGVVVIFGIPILREIPILCAEWVAQLATNKTVYVVAYIGGVFFAFPSVCIFIKNLMQ